MRLFALLLISMLASVSQAQTNLGSVVVSSPTRWTKAMSPITVSNVTLVSALTVDAGVTVRFGASGAFNLSNGSASQLHLQGTTAEPVVIQAATDTPWAGFIVPGTRSSRPVIRADFAYVSGLGSRSANITPLNLNFRFSDCFIESLAVIPAGLASAGTQISLLGSATAATGLFERCTIRGQTNGLTIGSTVGVFDCDFESVSVPIRGSRINITALPY
jgi:hypothetical protein